MKCRAVAVAAVGVAALTGCRVPSIPDLRAFEAGTIGMVDAVEGTYLATREVLDSAPLTPELQELHRELERERAELEATWGPVREALAHCREYASTLSRLVHRRDFSEGELKAVLTSHLEGLFGPVGMLAGPLMAVPAGHQLAEVALEIDRMKQARRTLRRLRAALRVIHPAIAKFSGELRGDFKELHDWTLRVFELLHEQNRVLHQEALRLEQDLDAREKQIAVALESLVEYAVHGHDLRSSQLPWIAQSQQRRRLARVEAPEVKQLRQALLQAQARVRQGQAAPVLARDLEALLRETLILGPLAAAADVLGAGPELSPWEQALDRVRQQRGQDLAGVEAALASQVATITGSAAGGSEKLRALRGALVGRIQESARRLTRAAEAGEGCDAEAALRGVLDAREAMGSRDHPVSDELDRLLVAMLRRGIGDLRAQVEAVRTGGRWPCGVADGHGDVELVASQEDRGVLGALAAEVDGLEARLSGDAAEAEAREFEEVLARARRLRLRAAAVGRLVRLDPDLAAEPPPDSARLASRETYWRDQLRTVNQQRLAIQHHLEKFAQRVVDLRGAEKHVRGLLHYGHESLRAWEQGHLNLAAIAGHRNENRPPAAHLEQVVAGYHDQLHQAPSGAPVPSSAQ